MFLWRAHPYMFLWRAHPYMFLWRTLVKLAKENQHAALRLTKEEQSSTRVWYSLTKN